jgi:hypothetical protein
VAKKAHLGQRTRPLADLSHIDFINAPRPNWNTKATGSRSSIQRLSCALPASVLDSHGTATLFAHGVRAPCTMHCLVLRPARPEIRCVVQVSYSALRRVRDVSSPPRGRGCGHESVLGPALFLLSFCSGRKEGGAAAVGADQGCLPFWSVERAASVLYITYIIYIVLYMISLYRPPLYIYNRRYINAHFNLISYHSLSPKRATKNHRPIFCL